MKIPNACDSDWMPLFEKEQKLVYFTKLSEFLAKERSANQQPVYPSEEKVFKAFLLTPYEKTQVVLLGQDPYHGPGQAHGLSFSVAGNSTLPPSLKNIFQELTNDLGIPRPSQGNLTGWAKEGVLLLNSILTVREKAPHSHRKKGWEEFTDAVITFLNARKDPVIFVLWGKEAQKKCSKISSCHFVLTAPHPSPYSASRGFFGCGHFSKINNLLSKQKKKTINWSILS